MNVTYFGNCLTLKPKISSFVDSNENDKWKYAYNGGLNFMILKERTTYFIFGILPEGKMVSEVFPAVMSNNFCL